MKRRDQFRDATPAEKRARLALAIIGAMVAAMASGLLPTIATALSKSGVSNLISVWLVVALAPGDPWTCWRWFSWSRLLPVCLSPAPPQPS